MHPEQFSTQIISTNSNESGQKSTSIIIETSLKQVQAFPKIFSLRRPFVSYFSHFIPLQKSSSFVKVPIKFIGSVFHIAKQSNATLSNSDTSTHLKSGPNISYRAP